jgi:hypothetical protein
VKKVYFGRMTPGTKVPATEGRAFLNRQINLTATKSTWKILSC